MVVTKDNKKCKECENKYINYGQKTLLCRPCKRVYDRKYHSDRSTDKKIHKQELQKIRIRETTLWVRGIKTCSGCFDCGINDWRVLDFDHLPKFKKEFTISNSFWRSREKIKKEIDKCEVVCANCHRIRTHERKINQSIV